MVRATVPLFCVYLSGFVDSSDLHQHDILFKDIFGPLHVKAMFDWYWLTVGRLRILTGISEAAYYVWTIMENNMVAFYLFFCPTVLWLQFHLWLLSIILLLLSITISNIWFI